VIIIIISKDFNREKEKERLRKSIKILEPYNVFIIYFMFHKKGVS